MLIHISISIVLLCLFVKYLINYIFKIYKERKKEKKKEKKEHLILNTTLLDFSCFNPFVIFFNNIIIYLFIRC